VVFGIVALMFVLATWKWGDWRNWKTYYPTMAFWVIGNYLYDTLTYTKPLWLYYDPMLNHTLNDLFWKFIIYPCVAVMFLYRYPKSGTIPKFKYFAFWIILFSVLEWLLYVFGYFLYYNNWNFWWSVAFNCMMFPLLRLHYTHPHWGWIGAVVAGISIIVIFKIPLLSLR